MLAKLYLHEFKALFRWLKFVWIGILALAIINRGMNALIDYYVQNSIQIEPSKADIYSSFIYRILTSLSTSLTVIYALASVAGMVISFGLVTVRFYKNLFTSEGYFTFSIPVTANQHLWCKLICGTIAILASFAVCALSLTINFLFTNIGATIVEGIKEISFDIEAGMKVHLFIYVIELIVISIISIMVTNLNLYCSIAFGQSFKNKIGGSILSYIVIKLILNCVTTFFTIFLSFGGSLLSIVFEFGDIAPELLVHFILIIPLILQIGLGVIYFVITSYRINKKLNLE